MNKVTKIFLIVLLSVLLVVLLLALFALGYFIGKRNGEAMSSDDESISFYAVIDAISGDSLLVDGFDINKINHRGLTWITVEDNTVLIKNNKSITIDDFHIGDMICVTYVGSILESYPSHTLGVTRIELFNHDTVIFDLPDTDDNTDSEGGTDDTNGSIIDVMNTQTFYATITDISLTSDNDYQLLVHGLDINDINHRGDFHFSVEDATILWHNIEIDAADLDVGDNIAVTYTGDVLEIGPAILTQVLKIDLLDDER